MTTNGAISDDFEAGLCHDCGEVQSDGEFRFDLGPRCPECDNVLEFVWVEPGNESIVSDTTVVDYLGGELR